MDVHVNNPDLQAKITKWTNETGRNADELIEDAVAGYFEELAQTRAMLDSRYDDIRNGKVTLMDGEQALARLKASNEAQRKATQ